ncbi:MAG: S41 family peptidase [Blastocatellia bacterium]|nr:S41 family peptidase [Blastocatellia bacterium]
MQRKLLPIALAILCTSAIIGGKWVQRPSEPVEASTGIAAIPNGSYVLQSYSEAQDMVNRHFIDEVATDQLTKASIQGMLHSLDPHSNYYDAKEFQELQSQQHSQYFGIGVSIGRRGDRVFVLGTNDDTPAEKAGLRYGDAIVAVNGKSALNWSSGQVSEEVRGPQGEFVEITVERVGVPKPLTFKIARDAVPYPSIRHAFMIRPGIGYVALLGGFNHTTDEELQTALKSLQSQGMESLILDLRGNGGGLLTQAVKVASAFLPHDLKVLSQKGRLGTSDGEARDYFSENQTPNNDALVVLINGGTASASEIVAGAIQDHDRGLIVGEPSFGKGLVQSVKRLSFGSGLTLTTAKYYTPSGRCVQSQYAGLSLYDYTHKKDEYKKAGEERTTDSGRKVYAGGGITPDVAIKEPVLTPVQIRLLNAAFIFSRQLLGGKVPNQQSFRVTQTQYGHRLKADEYVVNDKVIAAFNAYLKENPDLHLTDAQVAENLEYVRSVIRENVVTAAFGIEAGMEVRLQADIQTIKAVESVQAARALAENAGTLRNRSFHQE